MGQRADRDEVDAGLGDLRARSRARRRPRPRAAPGRRRAATASRISAGDMLSSRICSAPAASASRTSSSVSASTSIGRPLRLRAGAATAGATPPAARRWLSLIEDRVVEAEAVVACRRRSARRTSRARAAPASSCGCRGSPRRCRRPRRRSARVSVAIPERRPRRLSAVRSPVSTARVRPVMRASSAGARRDHRPPRRARTRAFGSSAQKTASAAGRPQTTPGSLSSSVAVQRRVLGDGGLGRHVAAADVLGERGERDALEIELLGYDHRSSTGSCPGRWTTWPASSGSSVGQSARKCAPRLSVARERARRDQPRRAGAGLPQLLEPGRVADEPGVLPQRRGAARASTGSRRLAGLAAGRGRRARARRARRARPGGRRRGTRATSSTRAGSRRGRPCRRTRRPRTARAARCAPSRSVTTPPIV